MGILAPSGEAANSAVGFWVGYSQAARAARARTERGNGGSDRAEEDQVHEAALLRVRDEAVSRRHHRAAVVCAWWEGRGMVSTQLSAVW